MSRRTKIVATIGPASDDESTLRDMIEAGMDVARLALAHGPLEDSLQRYKRIRAAADDIGRQVGVVADLPGPKVRCAAFPDEGIEIHPGAEVEITVGERSSSATRISVDYDKLIRDIQRGDRLMVGDGGVVVDVLGVDGDVATTQVVSGGVLRGRPGLFVPADRLSLPTPTPADFRFIDAFVEAGVDMLAVSFVRSAHDVRRVGTEPHPRGPLVIAKIETRAAVENLAGIIDAAGAIMVARGDLGNECAIEDLPTLQKTIIRECIAGGLPVITATQMLESMVTNTSPTRAEASDVANAVWDGSSGVMLSAETAIGVDPVNVVRTMSRIARRADEEFDHEGWARRLKELHMTPSATAEPSVTDAMTNAAFRAVTELGVRTILCISGSGFTVRSMARFRPTAKIIGVSSNERTVQQLSMSWGTTPMLSDRSGDHEALVADAMERAKDAGHIATGELVAVLAGAGSSARVTNMLRIERVS